MDTQRFPKLTRLMHFPDHAAASDESAVDVELGDRGPVRERLDCLADRRVCQHIDGVERHAIVCKRLDDRGREAALRPRGTAFHEENDGVELDGLGDTRLRIIDVNDVRHKSVSRHASAEYRYACICAQIDAYTRLSMDGVRCHTDAQACKECMTR